MPKCPTGCGTYCTSNEALEKHMERVHKMSLYEWNKKRDRDYWREGKNESK